MANLWLEVVDWRFQVGPPANKGGNPEPTLQVLLAGQAVTAQGFQPLSLPSAELLATFKAFCEAKKEKQRIEVHVGVDIQAEVTLDGYRVQAGSPPVR